MTIAGDILQNRGLLPSRGKFFRMGDIELLVEELQTLGARSLRDAHDAEAVRHRVRDTYSSDSVMRQYIDAYRKALKQRSKGAV